MRIDKVIITIIIFIISLSEVLYCQQKVDTEMYLIRNNNSNSNILNDDYWTSIESNTTAKLNKIKFIDSLLGISWGDEVLVKTLDGGNNWEEIANYSSLQLYNVSFINSNDGFALQNLDSNTVILYKTYNSGREWAKLRKDTNVIESFKMSFVDINNGWILGNSTDSLGHFFQKTNDGGKTWVSLPKIFFNNYDGQPLLADFNDIESIFFTSPNNGYYSLSARDDLDYYSFDLKSTSDGGYSWFTVYSAFRFYNLYCYKTNDDGSIWAIMDVGEDMMPGITTVIRKINGARFKRTESNQGDYLRNIFAVDSLNAWVTGYKYGDWDHTFWSSTIDGGRSWDDIYETTLNNINDIYTYNGSEIWAVGDSGKILKSIDWTTSYPPNLVFYNYKLTQNYPNPFNPKTTISYSIPRQTNVVIKIYDLLGKEVKTLVNEQVIPGNYKVEFDGSKLSSGTYFYQLQTKECTETKKLMLIK